MATNNAFFLEGQSIIRPPLFSGSHFSSWKQRMEVFLQSIDIELWFIVNLDSYETTTFDANMDRNRPKAMNELSVRDKMNLTLNAKAMNVLYNTLDANESTKIKNCKSAKEIWDKLCDIHEGNQDIREQKKSLLVAKYENGTS